MAAASVLTGEIRWRLVSSSLLNDKMRPLTWYLGVDSVAQLVEHNTFNVGVLGPSPSGVTKENK